ncbi:choline ABC transporter ATP-binding protein [Zhengella mangrovi]|uniref:Trimethylamine N-oxide transport system ATP-binding protein TmoW n=1 Tax=Zhengella mangrovi TaxID=1982044 RepID=A0A2G1QPA2_9HYPH|nr:choline ABC transporter ATP-binding protein [Zhengella mangrovi]PHP67309.1 choline ABC transporter ATP-binding protein [Zhengella mangrovi]
MSDHPAIRIDRVCIMFGDKPEGAMALADKGMTRAEIQEQTGQVLGVHECSLDIAKGEILVLMGLSGSGKSTLLRAINRLNPITRGEVTVWCDDAPRQVRAANEKTLREIRAHHVSMVFQQFALLPWRTVADNVGLGLELSGLPRAEREAAVATQLELVGLSAWADRQVAELSGGMQQRVGLARAFATGAPILLMDEPFSALDPLIRNRLQDELLDLQSRLKKTIVFVSHDLDEAMKIGNRIAIMEGGRIIQCGTPQDILLKPANDYVSDFVAHMNPVSVLTARDVMRPGLSQSGQAAAGTVTPQTGLRELIDLAASRKGVFGVIERGKVIGEVDAETIVAAIARYQRSDSLGSAPADKT